MIGWAGANYAARLDLEENSLTRVKNVHIFNRLLELDTLVLKQQLQVPCWASCASGDHARL